MNKVRIKSIAAVVVLFIVLGTVFSFAEPIIFTDIDGHWAEEYIEDVYERQLITGYPDATFKPQGNITKLEAITIAVRLMDYSDSDGQHHINQYKQLLEDSNVPGWGHGAVAYALFNDILSEDDLKSQVFGSGQAYAKRYEVAIYIGRVLQYGIEEEIGSIYVIPYKDETSIPREAKPYVGLLLNKKMLDKKSNGECFLPNDQITRAEVAKLVSLAAKILDDVSDDDIIVEPGPIISQPTTGVRRTVNGYIDSIIFGTKNTITIESEKGSRIYDVDPEANIRIDGKIAGIKQLEMGQTLTAIIEDNIVVDIKANSNRETLEGYFYYYLPTQVPRVFIKDFKDEIHNFLFTDNSRVYFLGKLIDIEDLNLGDMVTVTYSDDEAIEIKAEPREKHFEGVVKAKRDYRDKCSLEVLLDDETTETFTITSKANLKRDRRTAYFEDIKVGDEVEITTEYEVVISVNAFSIKRTVEGYISKMVLGQKTEPTEITIEKYNGTTETFILTPDTVIRVDEKRADIYDLRINYEVELEIENNEVSWIETYRRFRGSNYIGKIAYMDIRKGIFELEIGNREEIEIYVDDETMYIDEDGDTVRFRDIYVNDEIVAITEDNGYYIVAKKVIIITRR
ncbi:MAG: S-layer homology domain-containing protein [Natronincolaceae bacterium]|nr:S-layer homology domain-containing protein [Bacillota bacterium]NLK90532.1 S-layer homology domain-containing protein [Clostridiales bacterium]